MYKTSNPIGTSINKTYSLSLLVDVTNIMLMNYVNFCVNFIVNAF